MVLSVVSLVVTFSLELNLRITAPAQVLCDFTYGLVSCYSSTLLTAVSSDAMAPLHLNLKNKNRCARQISLTMMSDMKTHQSWNKMYMGDAKIDKLLLVAGADAHPGPPGPWPGVRPKFFSFCSSFYLCT